MTRELRTAEDLDSIQRRLQSIFRQMGNIQTRVDVIDSKVDEIKAMISQGHARKASLSPCREMPMKPDHFHGRDDVVADIARQLTSDDKPRACILGPGGIGKTSVALAVMENDAVRKIFSDANRFWYPAMERLPLASSCKSYIPAFKSRETPVIISLTFTPSLKVRTILE